MSRYYLSSAAEEDVLAAWDYIARDSVTAADRMIDRFSSAFERIARHPEAGARFEHSKGEFRFVIAGAYLVFYKLAGDEAAIVRVLHSARRWEDLL